MTYQIRTSIIRDIFGGVFDAKVQLILTCLIKRNLLIPAKLPQIPNNFGPSRSRLNSFPCLNLDSVRHLVLILPQDVISDERLIKEVNIETERDFNLGYIRDIVKTPEGAYFAWMWVADRANYVDRNKNRIVVFVDSERDATLREGIFFPLYYPQIRINGNLNGSLYDGGRVTRLNSYYPVSKGFSIFDQGFVIKLNSFTLGTPCYHD